MNQTIESTAGIEKLTDQVIASDLLAFAKTGVRTYASAVVESATPAIRNILKNQLDESISYQEQVNSLMIKKGWYEAYDLNRQIEMDLTQTRDTIKQINQF